jgi:tRNA dimethylallyltransferase
MDSGRKKKVATWVGSVNLKSNKSFLKHKYLLAVIGPTGVGKTAFAVELARYFKTAVLSADSRQVYKELKIGTARPGEEEMKGITHFFSGHKSIAETYTTADFEKEALSILEDLYSYHDIVVLCGGTGLYIDALCNGLDELPSRDEEIRKNLQELFDQKGLEGLQERLKELDPVQFSASDIHNPQRMMRAIEVCMISGKPYSEAITGKKKERPFHIIKIGIDREREKLYARINERVDEMIAAGLIEEARSVLAHKTMNALQTLGYKELFDYFEGKTSLNEAIDLIKQHSRNYAKRQLTWFRRDVSVKWMDPLAIKDAIFYIEKIIRP